MTTLFTIRNQIALGPLTPANIIGIIFFSTCSIICILFLKIAKNFKNLIIQWSKIEFIFLSRNYELPPTRWKLKKKIKVFLIVSLSFALVEHLLALADSAYRISYKVKQCNITNFNTFELFITQQLSYVISNLPFNYNNYVGVVLEYLNISYTFYWNFLDIFLVLISIGLTDRFERLNFRLESFQFLRVNENTW
jgi:gustatory receptor